MLDSDDDSGSESSSSEEEDEDAELSTPGMDLRFVKTIKALRNKDESIYDSEKRFFPSGDDDDDDEEEEDDSRKRSKPKRIKDVLREQVVDKMRRGDGEDDEDEEDENDNAGDNEHKDASKLAYDAEQRELRAAFLNSTKDDDGGGTGSDDDDDEGDDGGLLVRKMKRSGRGAEDDDEDEAEAQFQNEIADLEKSASNAARANDVSDPRGEVNDGEKFLLDFIKNKRWVDKSEEYAPSSDDDGDNDGPGAGGEAKGEVEEDDDASLDELDRMDNFESQYNFRFEEAAAAASAERAGGNHRGADAAASGAAYSVVGYSRTAASDSVRRKDDSSAKREARREKKMAERRAKEEKLRRLKNARREEMERKLAQVRAVLGGTTGAAASGGGEDEEEEGGDAPPPVDEAAILKLMEGDFDPDKFDKILGEAYGDDYYGKEDAEWKTDVDVKRLLKEGAGAGAEDIVLETGDPDHGDAYDEFNEEDDGDDAGNPQSSEDYCYGEEDATMADDNDQGGFDDEAAAEGDEGTETELEKKLKAKMTDELYKLDYEDIIGDMPTRFKYRKVEPNNYGLSTEEILLAKDTTLKQYVSLKKMAPYRHDEFRPNHKMRKKFREMLKQDVAEEEAAMKESGATGNLSGGAIATAIAETAGAEGGEPQATKKKRRRSKKKKKKGGSEKREEENGGAAADSEEKAEREKRKAASSGGAAASETKKSGAAGAKTADESREGELVPEKQQKRRRKKKGKKGQKRDMPAEHVEAAEEEEVAGADGRGTTEKPWVISADAPNGGAGGAKEGAGEAAPKKKKRKKKSSSEGGKSSKGKKKAKKSIAGVSASRLASYGL